MDMHSIEMPGADPAGRRAVGLSRWMRCLIVIMTGMQTIAAARGGGLRAAAPLIFHQGTDGQWIGTGSELVVVTGHGQTEIRHRGGNLAVVYEGANSGGRWQGDGDVLTTLNYLRGRNPEAWQTGLSGYGSVVAVSLYEGIDLRLAGPDGRLKSEFLVRAGADAQQIKLRHLEALGTRVDESGRLIIETGSGEWQEAAPYIYQVRAGREAPVEGAYRKLSDGTVGFQVGEYDKSLPLVIDPVVSFSSLLGSAGVSNATALAADGAGYVYVAGYSDSTGLPLKGALKAYPGGVDAYVAKLEPATGRLVWATYIGGSWDDRAFGIAIDGSGSVYVAGWTTSPDFPTKSAAQSSLAGYRDAFLVGLTSTGQLNFSTYFGGTQVDGANAVGVASGTVWIAGESLSSTLPGNGGAQPINAGMQDGFVAGFASNGALMTSTFVGGIGQESVKAVAIGTDGTIYVGGATDSPNWTAATGAQRTLRGVQDGFVIRLSAGAATVIGGTYLGGSGGGGANVEMVTALAIDQAQNCYATGTTPSLDFPGTNGWLGSNSGQQDAFLVRLDGNLAGVQWGTYLGGSGRELGNAVGVDRKGIVTVAGSTTSVDFPVVKPLQATNRGGGGDGFLVRRGVDGQTVLMSTYLGGSGADGINALAIAGDGRVELAGQSSSLDMPIKNPTQTVAGQAVRMFVTRVDVGTVPVLGSASVTVGPGWAQTFSFTVSHADGVDAISMMELLIASAVDRQPACRFQFRRDTNTLFLADDNSVNWTPIHIGTPEWGANSNCIVHGRASTASVAGNSLTLSIVAQFGAGFTGPRNLYMNAAGWESGPIGFEQRGSWVVTTAANQWPSARAVSPATGGGMSQVFRFTMVDGDGGSDIVRTRFIFNTSLVEAGGCSVLYEHLSNYVLLAPDGGGGWLPAARAGTAGALENSHCRIELAGTSSTVSGTVRTVNLQVTFASSFRGKKQVYALAADLSENGYAWIPVGAWNPSQGLLHEQPAFVSLQQTGASGSAGLFVVEYSDSEGVEDMASIRLHLHTTTGQAGACSMSMDIPNRRIMLMDDAGVQWLGPMTVGSASTLENSQCTIRADEILLSGGDYVMRAMASVKFKSAFNGSKSIYTQASDQWGLTSAWNQAGVFIVTSQLPNQTPIAAGMTPASGMGTRQLLTITLADANGSADINSAQVLMNSYPFVQQACYLLLHRPSNMAYLSDDSGTVFAPVRLGSQEWAQNSQCRLYGATSSMTSAGNLVIVTLDLGFTQSFESLRYVWANVTDVSGVTGPSPTLGQYGVIP